MKPTSLTPSDFQRALGTRPVCRTAHFSLHVLWREVPAVASQAAGELSTPPRVKPCGAVDDSGGRLGLVLPKKQARRAVTRSLIRHQARESVLRHAAQTCSRWQAGRAASRSIDAWVLRLTRGFDRTEFPSAASDALRVAVRAELDELWARAARVQA
ncbi:hypothetical protein GTZ97_00345 [Aquabacterium fontiphilum]|uniref:ribonuclease P protein component n=1 Tax=Aquabacterium fontiphilum TaxID=450365 RepID=UPI001377A929|nr:hypothetical protein [Aquabacterium fontiphilum]